MGRFSGDPLEPTPKREARKLLGLMDDNFRTIKFNQQDREALLVSVELQQVRSKAADIGFKSEKESLLAVIKSARQAKALANKRADKAEAALKKVRKALVFIDDLTNEAEIKQDA